MKTYRIYILAALSALAVALLVASCHTPGRSVAAGTSPVPGENVFAAMTGAYRTWQDVSVPVKVSVKRPASFSISGKLNMRHGEAMQLTLSMFFVEAANIYVDADSVIALSKHLGVYYAESLDRFTASMGLGIADVQSLVLGQAMAPGHGTLTPAMESDFTLEYLPQSDKSGYYEFALTPRKASTSTTKWSMTGIGLATEGSVPQLFALDASTTAASVRCTWADATASPAGPIAEQLQIEGAFHGSAFDAVVSGNAAKAKWNSGVTIRRPSIPSGARRVTTDQLMQMLRKI